MFSSFSTAHCKTRSYKGMETINTGGGISVVKGFAFSANMYIVGFSLCQPVGFLRTVKCQVTLGILPQSNSLRTDMLFTLY